MHFGFFNFTENNDNINIVNQNFFTFLNLISSLIQISLLNVLNTKKLNWVKKLKY